MNRRVWAVAPIAAAIAGLVLSIARFRADDALGGLASALGGVVLMIVLAIRMPEPAERTRD